jgi:chromosome segregation ATPase
MKPRKYPTTIRCGIALLGAWAWIVAPGAMPAMATEDGPGDGGTHCGAVSDELARLNRTVAELRDLLLARADFDRRAGLVSQLDTLDRNIAYQEAEVRAALDRREEIEGKLTGQRVELEEARRRASTTGEDWMRRQLEAHAEKLDAEVRRLRAQSAEIDAAIEELRRTISARSATRDALQQELDALTR